jgi:CO/xanthine dehydrogenase FAD-binding subunit
VKPPPFAYHRPESLEETVALLAEHGPDAALLAGGQSLVPVLNLRLAHPAHVVDINRVPGLDLLETQNGSTVVGAMVRQRAALESPLVRDRIPLLAEALPRVGHPETRNRGTLGGSLVHNDPAAEFGAVAMACDAEIVLRSTRGDRSERVADFLLAPYMTTRAPDELVVEVRIPGADASWGWAFAEISRRHHDFALVGVGVGLRVQDGTITDARLAYAGVGGTALRAREAEALLRGEAPAAELFSSAAGHAATELDPPTDVLASAEYRRHIARELTKRALATATVRAKGEE